MPTSLFMMDDSDSDKKELVVDFFLSWTLRIAGNKESKNKLLNKYSTQILSKLFFGTPKHINHSEIDTIKVWKQWNNIDLTAELKLKDGTKHALLMENKVYQSLSKDQLTNYKKIFFNHYKDKDFKLYYTFFTCHDEVSVSEIKACKEADSIEYENDTEFKAYTMDDVINSLTDENDKKGKNGDLTENPLFDEFWMFNWW